MLRTLAVALAASLAFGGAAPAAEGQGAHAQCKALAKLKAEFDAKTHVVQLTAGQFHFVEGVYVGSPSTPDGLPPGDGALLFSHEGDKDGIIVWNSWRARLCANPDQRAADQTHSRHQDRCAGRRRQRTVTAGQMHECIDRRWRLRSETST